MNFGFTNTVYELQAAATVLESVVEHDGFEEFCVRLRNLFRDTAELADDSWTAPLRKLRHYRFDQCAAPIGFGNDGVMNIQKLDDIERELLHCSLPYEHISKDVLQMVKCLRKLVQENENPLFQKITELLTPDQKVAILLKEARHISLLDETLKHNPQWEFVQIVSQQQLAKLSLTFDRLLCIGRSGWFNEFIFRTPRSTETRIIRYSWLPDSDCRKTPNFHGWKDLRIKLEKFNKLSERKEPVLSIGSTAVRSRNWELPDEDLIPRFDLAVIAKRFQSAETTDQGTFREDVQARLIELEGGRGTFVESDSSGVLAITLDENNSGKVERIPINSIAPGVFLLLRGDSDSDDEYIIPIADLILGKKADQLRRFQRGWKAKLRDVVKADGVRSTVEKLKKAGSKKASEVNLRNWLWHRNIRTDEPEDFFAIMRVIEMGDMENTCWGYAKQIDSAHRRAGRKIRQELLRQIRETDMNDLEQLGEMRFELEGIGGRPMLAVRIVRVSDFVSSVAPQNVNRLFHLEESFNG